ncbi:MAG: NAD(P)-dependent oxidoreductase, partial [Terriglobia bacterium]
AELKTALREADFVVAVAPLLPDTERLFNRQHFAAMRRTAYFINVGRGGLLDEEALTTALQEGLIAGAAIDVTEAEPLPPDSPLWSAPNLLITPHLAGASEKLWQRHAELLFQNLDRPATAERGGQRERVLNAMKAIQVVKYGAPEVLELRSLPKPTPRAGEVVVGVEAAGINFAAILMRLGLYPGVPRPPFTPGLEVAGTVEAVGADVKTPRAGDRVVVISFGGGYAEKLVVSAQRVIPLPAAVNFDDAAALPVNYLTAYQALTYMAHLRAGERVLIHAAAGGVGLAAIQFCRLAGAEMFGTASAAKHDFLRQRGLEHPIDYHTKDFEAEVRRLTTGEGVDVVLDAVGGVSYRKSYRLLRHGGRLICYGLSSAVPGKGRSLKALGAWWSTPSFNAMDLIGKNRAVMGVHLGTMGRAQPARVRAWMEELFRLYRDGKIKPHIGARFPLREAAQAHDFIHERKNLGKVLLHP